MLTYLLFGGRRRNARRKADKHDYVLVDQYSSRLLIPIVLVLVLSLADGFLTLYLIEHGAEEQNPVMDLLLRWGPWEFILIKFLLTCFGIICLCISGNMYIRPLGLPVKMLFPVLAILFSAVIGWQLFLIHVNEIIKGY
jgi:hypothetical protein